MAVCPCGFAPIPFVMSASLAAAPESYHTQHAPFGAFASFTVGLVDEPGGFGQSLGKPAQQNVYVGFKSSSASRWRLLPFFRPPQSQAVAYTGESAVGHPPSAFDPLTPSDFVRTLGWASDTWRAGDDRFGFSLLTPFGEVPEPRRLARAVARFHLAPVVCGWIEYDNRGGTEPVELVFGIGDSERPSRPLEDADASLIGFASGSAWGYATAPDRAVSRRLGFDVFDPKFKDYRGLHVIGGESALLFTVPAGKRKRFPLVLGFYAAGTVTTGIASCFAYTRYFRDLEDVLGHGLEHFNRYAAQAALRDRELSRSRLDADQRFLLAQATHSYYASSQLLWRDNEPLWVVNEGEYRMINTFDLTVDHLFFELVWHPWAVRNTLDLFVERYAYRDKIRLADGRIVRGGIAFTHDMGVNNHFTPPGRSSYECDELHGCFSHMTMEQLLNWVITGVCYAEKTGDRAWLRRNRSVIDACAESLRRRDHPDTRQRNGIPKHDSDRCGRTGSEITTYDSLDVSLGQARNNLYLAVKTLGVWLLLEGAYRTLKEGDASQAAAAEADRLARSVCGKFEDETGFFPAVFEAGNRSRILPAIEGLLYPLYLGYEEFKPKGRFGPLLERLDRHMRQALQPGICLDAVSGGWKMSSTSTNTWFSKIALAQHLVRRLFPAAMNDAARGGDRVHADWQRRPGCGAFAMCDQIHSETGVTVGSRYYPRGVTAITWMWE
jgi:xylan 1,4-beta-xylosidase